MSEDAINPFDILSGKVVKNHFGTFWFKEPGYNVDVNGTIIGKLHRENDLPAAIRLSGTKTWYKNGEIHRETGMAVIRNDGVGSYWLNNKRYITKAQFEKKLKCLQNP